MSSARRIAASPAHGRRTHGLFTPGSKKSIPPRTPSSAAYSPNSSLGEHVERFHPCRRGRVHPNRGEGRSNRPILLLHCNESAEPPRPQQLTLLRSILPNDPSPISEHPPPVESRPHPDRARRVPAIQTLVPNDPSPISGQYPKIPLDKQSQFAIY